MEAHTLQPAELEEARGVVNLLNTVLGLDNDARKSAEAQLKQIREQESDKYACYLSYIIAQHDAPANVRALSAVILRRALNTDVKDEKTLWEIISDGPKEFMKSHLLVSVQTAQTKDLIHKMCDLLVEIASAMYEDDETVWKPLFALIFQLVNDENASKVDGGLTILNGLFPAMIDEFNNHKDEMLGIFTAKLSHPQNDIQLSALQCVSTYLGMAQRKFTKPYRDLIPAMVQVVLNADRDDDEPNLKNALIEFNEIAEFEPKFFKPKFKEIFTAFSPICLKSGDQAYTDDLIRQQPLEWMTIIVERCPDVLQKDGETLKALLELVFKLMIDIDADIEQEWTHPKEGFQEETPGEDGTQTDNLHFGKSCIDNIVSAVGDQVCLPHLGAIVQQLMANEEDWRYKNAALMAFSQIGEYVDNVDLIAPMVGQVVLHLQHANPKVRYAAVHCVGQMADDMKSKFQTKFGAEVFPAMLQQLDDPIPRVSAHVCSALSNYGENSTQEQLLPYLQQFGQKLGNLIQNGTSLQKEHSVTALATMVVKIADQFDSHFPDTIDMLLNVLNTHLQPEYKQFRAQIIEAISLISSVVSEAAFLPHADKIVQTMLAVQNSQMDDKDPQRVYLLSAWQRICVIMKEKFTPYLDLMMPSILQMALLKPKIGVGEGEGEIDDVLNELKPQDDKEKVKINLNTDEIEDKDTAIQMLCVFIEELGTGFGTYAQQTADILVNMINFGASNSIRNSAVSGLPGLFKLCKEAQPDHVTGWQEMAKTFCNKIIEAMDMETETECLLTQVEAIKEIMEDSGENLLQPDSVIAFQEKVFGFIKESENRIQATKKMQDEELEAEDEEKLDDDDMAVFKEDIKEENELQCSLVEILGLLFKTHKIHCKPLVEKILTQVLPSMVNSTDKAKQKFLLYILDDMIEYLGPEFLGMDVFGQIVTQVCKYAESPNSAIRQAAVYGLGMSAQNGGAGFAGVSTTVLASLEVAINYTATAEVNEKKQKMFKFTHARDNAIAALGRVIRYQNTCVDAVTLIAHWVNYMPLQKDYTEAQFCNEFLAEEVMKNPALILGPANERLEKFVMILGEICDDEQSNEKTLDRLAVIVANLFQDATLGPSVKVLAEGKLNPEQQARVQATYNRCNEEVRQRVANMPFST